CWFNTRLGQPLRAEVEKNENERNSREACFKGFLQLQISEEDVKGIKVPLAVVVGSRDPTKRRYVEPLRKLRPEIPVTIVPGATHLTCIAKREFKDALVNFLDKQTKESAGGK
ncbi:hypothetical protein HY256_03935, partial [Candidatus Sumerlaeota bacterium]|nr:hypothetical protein [Candidatus Sumerlaeota bacterium]